MQPTIHHPKGQCLGKGPSGRNPADVYYDIFPHAVSDTLEIHLMDHLYPDMLAVNTRDDIRRWWEVMDRTTGEAVQYRASGHNEEETEML